jgi:hypothetical protein
MPLEQIILEYAVCEQLDSINIKPLVKEISFLNTCALLESLPLSCV